MGPGDVWILDNIFKNLGVELKYLLPLLEMDVIYIIFVQSRYIQVLTKGKDGIQFWINVFIREYPCSEACKDTRLVRNNFEWPISGSYTIVFFNQNNSKLIIKQMIIWELFTTLWRDMTYQTLNVHRYNYKIYGII